MNFWRKYKTRKKCLIEIEYEDEEISPPGLQSRIYHIDEVYHVKLYWNKENLCVDEASKQCLNCPANFTQER
jgi:hypothetical protein